MDIATDVGTRPLKRHTTTCSADRWLRNRSSGHSVDTLKVMTSRTSFGVSSRTVFGVILGTVLDLLPVNSYGPVAMHTSNVARKRVEDVFDWHFFPAPLVLIADLVPSAALAARHHVMRHAVIPGSVDRAKWIIEHNSQWLQLIGCCVKHRRQFLRLRPGDVVIVKSRLPFQADLPERAAELADVGLFLGWPTDSINSEIRTSRARMSAGSSANSASTVSFNVSTVHAHRSDYTKCGVRDEFKVTRPRRTPSTSRTQRSHSIDPR
jgi:hypothetical protein